MAGEIQCPHSFSYVCIVTELRTYCMLNSTGGILTAMLSCLKIFRKLKRRLNRSNDNTQNEVFLIGRDAHKSVFDGLNLAGTAAVLLPCTIDPIFQVSLGIQYEDIVKAINMHDGNICALILTRPSYQGVMSSSADLSKVVSLCHQHSIPVIIDEAHGSHLKFLNRKDYAGRIKIISNAV